MTNVRTLKKILTKKLNEVKKLMTQAQYSLIEEFMKERALDKGKKKASIERLIEVLSLIDGNKIKTLAQAENKFKAIYQKAYQAKRKKDKEETNELKKKNIEKRKEEIRLMTEQNNLIKKQNAEAYFLKQKEEKEELEKKNALEQEEIEKKKALEKEELKKKKALEREENKKKKALHIEELKKEVALYIEKKNKEKKEKKEKEEEEKKKKMKEEKKIKRQELIKKRKEQEEEKKAKEEEEKKEKEKADRLLLNAIAKRMTKEGEIDKKWDENKKKRLNTEGRLIKQIMNYNNALDGSDKTDYTKVEIERPTDMPIVGLITILLEHLTTEHDLVLSLDNDFYYTLNDNTRGRLYDLIMSDISIDQIMTDKTHGSDAELLTIIMDCDVLILTDVIIQHTINAVNAGFFKYYNLTNIDLSRYQIFQLNDKKENYTNNCLVHAFEKGGMDKTKLNFLKTYVKNREISRTNFGEICETLDISIKLRTKDTKNDTRHNIGTSKEKYHIGDIDNHYFIIEDTEYTQYSIIHYDEVKDLKDFNYIYEKRKDSGTYRYNKTGTIDSFDLIKWLHLYRDKYLTKLSVNNSTILTSQFYNKMDLIPDELDYLDSNIRPIKSSYIETDENDDDDYINVFFDVETFTKDSLLKGFILCFRTLDKNNKIVKRSFTGLGCVFNFLNNISKLEQKRIVIIAHYAGFDYRFLIQYLTGVTECYRDNHFISASGYFKKKKIVIKDSYNLLGIQLKQFHKTFKSNRVDDKGIMPFSLYTEDNIKKKNINISEALEHIHDEKEKKIFTDKLEEMRLIKGGKFDSIKYAVYYCQLDCEILMEGYNMFRGWILTDFNMDIDKINTITGLSHNYFIREGCFDNVVEMSGIPQLFIAQCTVGGRCMINENKKSMFISNEYEKGNKETDSKAVDGINKLFSKDKRELSIFKNNTEQYYNNKIDDRMECMDKVSLYSTGMVDLGYLQGRPKVLRILDYEEIKEQHYDGLFVEIIIESIGKHRGMSNISYKDDNGVRQFDDNIVNYIDKPYHCDHITLDELIKFHEIKFRIIKGYYFDEGLNLKSIEVTNRLFELRKKYKQEGNPIQKVYKDLLNCPYGRTLLKPSEYETVVVNNYTGRADTYLSRNYNKIHSYKKDVLGSNNWRFKVYKEIDNHFNAVHIGSTILAKSKYIMNRVICLAEDNDIFIYYQDTDSIHLLRKDYIKLEKLFYEEYGMVLTGKNLGQMHPDFEVSDEEGNKMVFSDIYAIRSIFLGKKTYCEELLCLDIEGNISIHYHTRSKGVPCSTMNHTIDRINKYCEDNGIDYKLKNPFELYELMFNNIGIEFDLLQDGKNVKFKLHRDYSIESLDDFCRYLKF